MGIMHRRRAIFARLEESGGKRASLPVEYERASTLPPMPVERVSASSRAAKPAVDHASTSVGTAKGRVARKTRRRAKAKR